MDTITLPVLDKETDSERTYNNPQFTELLSGELGLTAQGSAPEPTPWTFTRKSHSKLVAEPVGLEPRFPFRTLPPAHCLSLPDELREGRVV